MFWDRVACVYDIFANVINKKANKTLCAEVEKLISPRSDVLECACGTGLLTKVIAPRCKSVVATDFSAKMLKRAKRKCKKYGTARFEFADVLNLPYANESFDTVVAANVIHLLDEPLKALGELDRVCKSGGKIIIPTYINRTEKGKLGGMSGAIKKAGADFKREFTLETYKQFFADAGYRDVDYVFCRGKIPCAVAVIKKD